VAATDKSDKYGAAANAPPDERLSAGEVYNSLGKRSMAIRGLARFAFLAAKDSVLMRRMVERREQAIPSRDLCC